MTTPAAGEDRDVRDGGSPWATWFIVSSVILHAAVLWSLSLVPERTLQAWVEFEIATVEENIEPVPEPVVEPEPEPEPPAAVIPPPRQRQQEPEPVEATTQPATQPTVEETSGITSTEGGLEVAVQEGGSGSGPLRVTPVPPPRPTTAVEEEGHGGIDPRVLARQWMQRVSSAILSRARRDYPRAALRQHLEGTVIVSISVSPSGHITGVTVQQTSGHSRLDEAAIAAVQAVGDVPQPPDLFNRRHRPADDADQLPDPMKHVVEHPTAPFETSNGALTIHQIPAWQDNLVWLAVCNKSGAAAVIDGPDAGGLLDYCAAHGIELTTVLNTHTHGDHVGVNRDLDARGLLSKMTVYGPKRAAGAVPGITNPVDGGDTVRIGEAEGRVLLTEGHIDGHVSYVFDDVVFCGDTMFAAGCGYLFDGPPAKMHDSLSRLAALSEGTRVCCAHEYTEDNLRFAWSVDPDNEALADRIRRVWQIRSAGGCTVPSTIGEERATNPFLRHGSTSIASAVRDAFPDRSIESAEDIFAATRALKDRKDYRKRDDSSLPL